MKAAGDGNFHLQLRRKPHVIEKAEDSLVGDAGFWAVESEFTKYTAVAEGSRSKASKVSYRTFKSATHIGTALTSPAGRYLPNQGR